MGPPGDNENGESPPRSHAHHQWLAQWQVDVGDDYRRLHEAALRDPQYAGHGAEATWRRLLQEWLPPAYEVGTRKYIVPEQGEDSPFETDLVVFNPSYPERLRQREQVLTGGVAAAFSVRLTADSAGLRDAASRGARLRRASRPRFGSPRGEVVGAFAFGFLAHSHCWKQPGSTPRENLRDALWEFDNEYSNHPRETLDFVCVADLTTVSTHRIPYMSPHFAAMTPPPGVDTTHGTVVTAMTMDDEKAIPGPVAAFIAALLVRLAQADPSVAPLADGLRLTGTLGSGSGRMRSFPVRDVYSEGLLSELPRRQFSGGDWSQLFY